MRAQRGNFHLPGDLRTPRRQSKQEKLEIQWRFRLQDAMNWNLRHWEVVDLFNEAL